MRGIVAHVLDLLSLFRRGIAIDAIIQEKKPLSIPLALQSWLPTDPQGQFWLTSLLTAVGFLCGTVFHWTCNWGWNTFT